VAEGRRAPAYATPSFVQHIAVFMVSALKRVLPARPSSPVSPACLPLARLPSVRYFFPPCRLPLRGAATRLAAGYVEEGLVAGGVKGTGNECVFIRGCMYSGYGTAYVPWLWYMLCAAICRVCLLQYAPQCRARACSNRPLRRHAVRAGASNSAEGAGMRLQERESDKACEGRGSARLPAPELRPASTYRAAPGSATATVKWRSR